MTHLSVPYLTIHLFGPSQLLLANNPINLTQKKPIALLCYLAATRQMIAREELALLLWPESKRAKDNLRNVLWLCQEALGEWGKKNLVVERSQVGFRSDADMSIDLHNFLAASQNYCLNVIDSHESAKHIAALNEICMLYSGEFLNSLTLRNAPTFDAWQFDQRKRLQQDFISVLSRGIDAFEQMGEIQCALRFTQKWVDIDSAEETAHAKLMSLYAQSGQHASAIRQFDTCQKILRRELDVEPSQSTQLLVEEIQAVVSGQILPTARVGKPASGDDISDIDADIPILNTHTALAPPSNLPRRRSLLLGREADLQELTQLLSDSNIILVTLTGPGGVGKTRLAIEAASRLTGQFTDGICLVNLAPVRHADFVMPSLLAEIHATSPQIAANQANTNKPSLELLKTIVGQHKMLIVLDNFEHVLDAGIQLAELIDACPNITVLTTSREPLHLYQEHQFLVEPLSTPTSSDELSLLQIAQNAAVQLFCQRAKMSLRKFELNDANANAVTEICQRLDGMPLALELAAPYMKNFSAQELLQRFDNQASLLLAAKHRNIPERHRTLASTIAWSYGLLNSDEQRLFRCVSVFRGGFTIDGAATVWDDSEEAEKCLERAQTIPTLIEAGNENLQNELETSPLLSFTSSAREAVLNHLSSLANKSLVQAVLQPDGITRYSLLETVREFGLEQLKEIGENVKIQRRHAIYCLSLAVTAEVFQKTGQYDSFLTQHDRERYNMNAAIAWAMEVHDFDLASRMALALYPYWSRRRHTNESAWMLRLLPYIEQTVPPKIASTFIFKTAMTNVYSDIKEQDLLFEKALQLARIGDNQETMAYALALLADRAYDAGDYETADSYGKESLKLHLALDDQWGYATKLSHIGWQMITLGEVDHGAHLCEEALTIHRKIGDAYGLSIVLVNYIRALIVTGDLYSAGVHLEEGLTLAENLGNDMISIHMHILSLDMLTRLGKLDQAAEMIRDILVFRPHLSVSHIVRNDFKIFVEFYAKINDPESALFIWAYIDTVICQNNTTWTPLQQEQIDRLFEQVSCNMTERQKVSIMQRGQTATLEEVVEHIQNQML